MTRSEFAFQQATQSHQFHSEITEERLKANQAAKSFSELERMIAIGQQQYEELKAQRQQDQQRLFDELSRAYRAEMEEDRDRAKAEMLAELAEGNANFQRLES